MSKFNTLTLERNLENCSNARERKNLDRRKKVKNNRNELNKESADNSEHSRDKLAKAATNRRHNGAKQRELIPNEHEKADKDWDDELLNYC